ncbi:MAG TPA: hypothetical protein VNG51_01495 [Ktedonobacteraceae bacterium]|nr:hypothetical protein [Ktedonobacteraceae bacterium]
MSQQMNFDEEQRSYSTGYTPHASYEDGPDVRPPVNEPTGYKLGQDQFTPRSSMVTAGQRLALAIVSVAILVPILGTLLGDSSMAFFELTGRLIGLGVICLTIAIINVVFNRGR